MNKENEKKKQSFFLNKALIFENAICFLFQIKLINKNEVFIDIYFKFEFFFYYLKIIFWWENLIVLPFLLLFLLLFR